MIPEVHVEEETAHEGKSKRFLGFFLEVVGRIITIVGAISVVVLFQYGSNMRVTDVPIFGLGRAMALFGLGICILGLKIQLLGRRYDSPDAVAVLSSDPRAPVIYLRPFDSDLAATTFSESGSLSQLVSESLGGSPGLSLSFFRLVYILPRLLLSAPRTEEEQLAYALKAIGPTVAVADPAQTLAPAGIPRFKLHPDKWRDEVLSLFRQARLVVVRCGSSPDSGNGYWPADRSEVVPGGIGWELGAAVAEVPPGKLILLSPFDSVEHENFRYKTRNVFPKGLPTATESNPHIGGLHSIIWFDSEWNATLSPITWVETGQRFDTLHPLAQSLTEKLKTVLQIEQTSKERLILVLKRALATLIDIVLVFSSLAFLVYALASLFIPRANLDSLFLVVLAVSFLLMIVYDSVLTYSSLSATYGKNLFGLVVARSEGSHFTYWDALKRSGVKFLLLPVTWARLPMGDGRTLHDVVGKTYVTNRYLRTEEPRRAFAFGAWVIWALSILYCGGLITYVAKQTRPLTFPSGSSEVTLEPIQLDSLLLIPVTVHDQQLWFLLSSVAGQTLINSRTADALKLQPLLGASNDRATGNTLHFREGATVELGAARLTVSRFIEDPDLDHLGGLLHRRIDGIIGYDIFYNSIVVLDYGHNRVIVKRADSKIRATNQQTITLSIRDGWSYVSTKVDIRGCDPQPAQMYRINTALVNDLTYHDCRNDLPAATPPGTDTKRVTEDQVTGMQIGPTRFNLASGCCAPAKDGRPQIGAGLLKRFRVTLDYPHSQLLLEDSQ